MARVLCLDDYLVYAEMVGLMLKQKGGHEVKIDVVPLVIEDVLAFDPDVIVINLVRKTEALGAPLRDFFREVDGAKAFKELAAAPETKAYPIVLTALALREVELPLGLHYEAFIEVPQKVDYLLHTIDRLAKAKREGLHIVPE